MTKKTFLIYKVITAVLLSLGVSLSVSIGNWYLPIILIVGGFLFLLSAKKNVKDIIADERDYRIAGKASYFAMVIYVMISVIIGLVVRITTGNIIGDILLYAPCALLFLYSILFAIFIKKNEN
jgi:uncharacterized membrane protein